ncbi:hypothetical protein HNY73_021724 [Argiope bruennichi]|uniref:Uncharacterized protein n=1 Tax=Argiope bruennichi TaxID=94029 RepID=A0A8T0E0C7_ARGBR|nr:hypothetical protein HNY73_021724 [Argiope bruennichi]
MSTDYQFEAVSMPSLPKLPTDTWIYLGCKRLTLLHLKEKQPFLPCIAAVESTTCGPTEDARRSLADQTQTAAAPWRKMPLLIATSFLFLQKAAAHPWVLIGWTRYCSRLSTCGLEDNKAPLANQMWARKGVKDRSHLQM